MLDVCEKYFREEDLCVICLSRIKRSNNSLCIKAIKIINSASFEETGL